MIIYKIGLVIIIFFLISFFIPPQKIVIYNYLTKTPIKTEKMVIPEELKVVAFCESSGRQELNGEVVRSKTNDVGLFQISEQYHGENALRLGINIYDETGNIEYALLLYKNQGLQPWKSSSKCWKPLLN